METAMDKVKPARHLRSGDMVVFTSQVSGKRSVFRTLAVNEDFEDHRNYPIRVTYATAFDHKGKCVETSIVGYKERENVVITSTSSD